ncbi:MAG TPA: CoA pyrophosphatase [Candidatus Binatia bacterium]|nr:CoA pyrophosphatase [Candidatus Binatia bacterium]
MLLSTPLETLAQLAGGLAAALAARPRRTLDHADKTAAAVLVPLLAVDDDLHLLYTRRAASLPHHQGQVAFPGGAIDPGDADPAAAALREAREEIGLDPGRVRVLGVLDDLETVSTRFVITPVVGLVPHPYPWHPSPHEVDAIFTVPVRTLEAPGTARREVWDFGGGRWPVDLYAVDGHVIWGATQRITAHLLELLRALR